MSHAKADEAARLLAASRQSGRCLASLPPALDPGSEDEAYDIQAAAARLWGELGGWKIVLPQTATAGFKAAPVPASACFPSGYAYGVAKQARIELEVALRLSHDLPPRSTPYDEAEVSGAIGGAVLSFEILGHRFADRNAVSKLAYLADAQGNAGIVIGGSIADWQNRHLDFTLEVDGACTPEPANPFDMRNALDGMVWLANLAAIRFGGLKAGQVVLTGARIGPVTVAVGQSLTGHEASGAVVALTLEQEETRV